MLREETQDGFLSSFYYNFQVFVAALIASFKYVVADFSRNRRTLFIAVTTVALVVGFVLLLQNSISRSPIIFLKLAENQVGEADLLLQPSSVQAIQNLARSTSGSGSLRKRDVDPVDVNQTDTNQTATNQTATNGTDTAPPEPAPTPFGLNYTLVNMLLKPVEGTLVAGATPRWTTLARVTSEYVRVNSSSVVMVINSTREQEIGLGRDWHHRPLGQQEAHVSRSLLYQLGVEPNTGGRIQLTIPIGEFIPGGVAALQNNALIRAQAERVFRDQIHSRNFTLESTQGQVAEVLGLPAPPADQSDRPINVTVVGSQVPDSLIDSIFNQFFDSFLESVLDAIANGFEAEFSVIDAIDDPKGKWSTSLGNVIVIESKYIGRLIRTLLPENTATSQVILSTLGITPEQIRDIENYPINDHALQIIIQKHDRMKTYLQTYVDAKVEIISWSNEVSLVLGLDFDASYQAELILSLSVTQYFSIFMDQIFTSVSVILCGLGAMLIYSLLIADINEKTFEYGMLRALGLPNTSLIVILTTQAIFYAVPGILIGILLGAVAFAPLAGLLGDYAATTPDYSLDPGAVIVAVLLGFFLPIIANIVPIQRVLSRTLRDALDIFFTGDSTNITFRRLDATFDFNAAQTSAAILMSVFGFIIYYVVPYAFFAMKTSAFLGIMNWILLGMVFGCIILSTTFQPLLERIVVFLSMWGSERAKLSELVKKSLSGHRVRNRKTALMFTISLAFVIFAGAMFALQTRSLNSNIELLLGANMIVFSPRSDTPLNEAAFREFFQSEAQLRNDQNLPQRVIGYTFMTYPLFSSSLADLAGVTSQGTILYGLESNYLESTYSQFYLPSEVASSMTYKTDPSSGKPDIVASLYTHRREQTLPDEVYLNNSLLLPASILNLYPLEKESNESFTAHSSLFLNFLEVIVSEAVHPSFQLSTSLPGALRSYGNNFYLKFRAFVKKLPGFLFSSYPQSSWDAPMIMSMDSFRQVYPTDSNPDYQRLLLRLRNDLTVLDRAAIINGLRSCLNDSLTQVLDTNDILESSATATSLILVFFNVISLIAILMCFFSLWLSFIANVNENAWEFGVLRAVGLTAPQVVRIYLYEAFALILSAVALSTMLGVAIAATLTLQFDIFTEMLFEFSFPSFLFISVSSLSIFVAFAGSYLASRDLGAKPIAAALKGL